MSVLTGSLIYEKLGERAFGWPGKIAAFGSITMQNIGGRQRTFVLLCILIRKKQYSIIAKALCACYIDMSITLFHVILQPCPATSLL